MDRGQHSYEAYRRRWSGASDFVKGNRLRFCTPEGLRELTASAGLQLIESTPLQVPTVVKNFGDYWHPFALEAGAAPGYFASLSTEARHRLQTRL